MTEPAVPVRQRTASLALRLMPIMIMLLYLNGTVFLFAYGPWRFPMDDTSQLYVFLALSHCALLGGYLSGIVRQPKKARYKIRPGTFVTVGAAATLFMLFPTSAARTGHAIPDIIAGINDPGVAYDQSQYIRNLHPSAVEYIRIFLAPLFSLSLPFTIFGWQTLTKSRKILGVSAILATVALYVSMGTNKAIADCALLTPWMLAAGHFSGVSRLNRTKVLLSLGLTAAGILGFITFFSNTFATRSESGAAAGYFTAIRTYADPDNFLVRDLSPAGKVTVYGLSGYITAGYYALYLSLKEPFVPMYGAGNSMFLTREAERFLDLPGFSQRSYPARIEKYGWSVNQLWCSIYPWIASDISFPGVIVVVFLVGHFFALAWLDTLMANPFALLAFTNFLIMLIYFSGNNQMMQSGEGGVAFWVLLFAWLLTRTPIMNRRGLVDGRSGAE